MMRRQYLSYPRQQAEPTDRPPGQQPRFAGMQSAIRRRNHVSRFLLRVSLFAMPLALLIGTSAGAQALSGYPGMGSEPSKAAKFSSSVKSGFNKMTKALIPKIPTKKAPDPISLSVPAKPSPEFHVAVARMAEQSGDLAKAEHHYRQALELTPDHADALMGYAHMLDRQDKLPEAAGLYQLVVQKYPRNPTAHNDLGICYARQGKLDEAVASIEKAVQLQPKQPRYRNNIATILVQSQQIERAFSHLSAIHPEAVAYYNLGYLLQKAGDKTGAARLFQEALVVDPSLTQARVWLEQIGPATAEARPAKQPQAIARRQAPTPPAVIGPTGSAAPMPPTGSPAPMPQMRPTRQMAVPNQTTPQQLAPLPPIRPLPPIHQGY
jgi:Flp pilus assembly protein TadD